MNNRKAVWFSGVIVSLLALTALAGIVGFSPSYYRLGEEGVLDLGGLEANADETTPAVKEEKGVDSIWKIDPSLRDLISSGAKELAKVVVVTDDVGALARAIQGYQYKGLIGTKARPTEYVVPVTLELSAGYLPEIASLDSVKGIYRHETPVMHYLPNSEWEELELPAAQKSLRTPEMVKGLYSGELAGLNLPALQSESPPEMHDFGGTEFFLDAPQAWANGFTGDGVKIALIDSGVDFAHPDLQGTQARFDVSDVPAEILAEKPYLAAYDGWPIAFDPLSLGDFLAGGGDLSAAESYSGTAAVLTKEVKPEGDFVNITRDSPVADVQDFPNQDISQDWPVPCGPWEECLTQGSYTRQIIVPDGTIILQISVTGHGNAPDVDVGLFFDANGDMVAQTDEYVDDSSTGDYPETISVTSPATQSQGWYLLKVLGFEVTGSPGQFDLTLTLVSIQSVPTLYNVTGITSQSGDYHLGFYPDAALTDVYFTAPAVLVVDSAGAGVYDTVYVDLNDDKDFTDEKAAMKGDEILFRDVDGDGLADISGGMVYFISNATTVPEYTVVTAIGGETFAQLAHGDISVPERITVYRDGVEWRTTSVPDQQVIAAAGGETEIQLDDTNLVEDTLVLSGTDIEVLDELALTVEVPAADTGFEVSNDNLLDIAVFRERASDTDGDGEDDWFGPNRVKLVSPDDYAADLLNGTVSFTANLTNNPDPFESNMAGDEFHAFYNYSGPMDPATAFTIDFEAGKIMLSHPLKAGATVNASYDYYNWVLDYIEGNLTFTHPLGAGEEINATYQYGWVPIPGSDSYVERLGLDNYYAGNGDLVAFMGPFRGTHGTNVASTIVGQGNALLGRARGVAPDAKIISIRSGIDPSLFQTTEAGYFAVEGYDGVPATGDEGDISSNSWGSGALAGWTFQSRFWDWLATNYSKGNTSIAFSSGNSGPGYGTVGSPNAPGLIMIGGAQQFFYRILPEQLTRSYDGGPTPMGGDAWYAASIGPVATGQVGVDAVAAASFVHVSVPLNTFGPDFDGFSAIDFVSGTSFSAPTAAGVLALAYDAYKQRMGEYPDYHTIKAVLMSGAEDKDSDVFVQGSGYVNALRSTNIANGLGGAFVTPYNWIPGDYRGDRYEVSARLMEPGDSETQMFTLSNTNGTDAFYDIAGEAVTKFGEVNYTYNPSDLLQPAGSYGSGSLFYVLNETGIWDLYTHTMVQAIDSALWNDAELLRLSEAIPQADYPGDFYFEVHRLTEGIVNNDWRGHTAEVKAADISPDGTMMASAGADGRIFVVDTGTSEIIWELEHPGPVGTSGSFNTFDVKFAPNSTWLAASLGDFNISIWDVSSGSLVNTLTAPAEVIAIDLSPNGTWMVAGQWDSNVTIWDITTSTMISIFNQTLVGPVNDVAFSPNGTWVASLDYGWWEVDLWNVTTLVIEDEFLTDPTDTLAYPMAVEFNPTNGEEVAYAMKYGWYLRSLGFPEGLPGLGWPDIAVYDIGLGDYTGWWAGQGDVVMDISWSDDGSKIASSSGLRPDLGGDDNSVKVWDATQNDEMLENIQKFFDFVNKVDFAPSGISLATADDEGAALVIDTTDSGIQTFTVSTALIDEFDNGIWYERNRQVTSFTDGNVETVRVHDPAARDPEGIIIWTRDAASSSVDTTVRVTIEFYKKTTWGWLSLDASNVTVPGDGSAAFNATIDVPADAGVGAYEAAIYLRNATLGDIVVPVMVNVLGKSPMITFGGNLTSSGLYDNSRLYYWSGANGDRRYYFFDVEDTFAFRDGMRLLVDINMTFMDSNGNIRHYQQASRGVETVGPDDRYGPFFLEETDVGAPGIFKKTLDWQDQGNGLLKGLTVGPGLNLLEVQGVTLDGSTFYETIEGRTGLIQINPASVDVYTNELSANITAAFTSTLPLAANPDPFDQFYGQSLAALVASPRVSEFLNIPIEFDGEQLGDETFNEYLTRSLNTMYWVVDSTVVTVEFHLMGQAFCCPDMDLGIFLDENEDGIAQLEEFVDRDADADADETVRILLPTPGTYIIKMAGFAVDPVGSLADMIITELFVDPEAPVGLENIPTEIQANQPASFNLAWSYPPTIADGTQDAAFFLSPGQAPLSFPLLVPVLINIDREAPTLADFSPAPGTTTTDTTPSILVAPSDTGQLDKSSLSILLDGVDITSVADVAFTFDDEAGGYFTGVVTYTPATALVEGSHLVEAEIADLAGNLAEASWAFTIDTSAPSLRVTSPAEDLATSSSSLTINGDTEPGAAVTVRGQSVTVTPQGTFSAIVSLSPGVNSIEITSKDSLGNSVTVTRIVTLDTAAPIISQVRSSAGLLTNQDSTIITGSVDEGVSLMVGGTPTTVRADRTFEASVNLVEGSNAISIVTVDLAGNQATETLTVTRDTAPPTLTMEALPDEASDATLSVSGTVESGISFVTVNGQPVAVSAGAYSTEVALSFGTNEIFVEATDAAGNTKSVSASVSYVPTGVTVASVGLILLPVLTVVGLLIGLALGQRGGVRPSKPESVPPPERPQPAPEPSEEPEVPEEGGE